MERCLEGMAWDDTVYAEYGIPPHLHGGLTRYLQARIRPGRFIYSVLTNDLNEAMLRWAGPGPNPSEGLIRFFCSEVPAPCWGSVDKVEAYLKG